MSGETEREREGEREECVHTLRLKIKSRYLNGDVRWEEVAKQQQQQQPHRVGVLTPENKK